MSFISSSPGREDAAPSTVNALDCAFTVLFCELPVSSPGASLLHAVVKKRAEKMLKICMYFLMYIYTDLFSVFVIVCFLFVDVFYRCFNASDGTGFLCIVTCVFKPVSSAIAFRISFHHPGASTASVSGK